VLQKTFLDFHSHPSTLEGGGFEGNFQDASLPNAMTAIVCREAGKQTDIPYYHQAGNGVDNIKGFFSPLIFPQRYNPPARKK